VVALDAVGTNLQHRHEVATVTRFPRDFDIAKVCSFGVQGDPCLAAWRNGDRLWPYAHQWDRRGNQAPVSSRGK